ncbi:MAG: hypothetical protein LBT65_08560 [Synergistaceae bacterium]|jgi:hypothetical protein|nr:hypothetical protein [Synergistaceae bacterium]
MAMNFDVRLNQARSVIRGEVNGGTRFIVMSLCAAIVWISVSWASGLAGSATSTHRLQQGRYGDLARLAAEYRALAPERKVREAGETDTMMAFTQVSEEIALGDRVSRIVPMPDGKRLSVEVVRIYAPELTDMIRELSVRGIRVLSAEIRALPAGEERLFSITAILAPEL